MYLIFRLVILNDKGQRIIDTLINVDDKKILIKPGKRLILKNIGN